MNEAEGMGQRTVMVRGKPVPVGTLVRDTDRDKTGVLRGEFIFRIWLRPQGGGLEWGANPDSVVRETEESG